MNKIGKVHKLCIKHQFVILAYIFIFLFKVNYSVIWLLFLKTIIFTPYYPSYTNSHPFFAIIYTLLGIQLQKQMLSSMST